MKIKVPPSNQKSAFFELIKEDFRMWKEIRKERLIKSFFTRPEFRYLLYYRIKILFFPTKLLNFHHLYIVCQDIGGGLFLEHAFSTIIACEKMGARCYVNQQVTIGYNGNGAPRIGDDVSIKAGAKVIGKIIIGDDVVIGANAVVTKDVPSHSVVVGCPGRIIKTRNSRHEPWQRCDIKL